FRRQGGRILLTEAGRQLYPYAQRILALHQEARQLVTGRKAPVAGDPTLAANTAPREHLPPGFLSTFPPRYPPIPGRPTVADPQAALRQVEYGQAQLGLVGGKGDSPHLEYRPFASDRMVLVVPAGHPLADRKQITLRQLEELPLILREAGSGSRSCLEQA